MNENENLQPIAKLTPFTKMVMSIGTLPSSFYASMSYYESMVWLYEYLKNQVIPTVNNNAEAVEELQGIVTTLKNFIDTYFENLDLQEEVNKKLDEMAEDGTLQTLFNSLSEDIYTYIDENNQVVTNSLNQMNNKINTLQSFNMNPIPVSSTDGMTDTSKIYLLTTNGEWYYYDSTNTTWTSGGSYQSAVIGRNQVKNENLSNTVTDDKRFFANNLIGLADEIKENKRLTGYNPTTYLPSMADDSTCTTLIFSVATLLSQSDYLGFTLPPASSTQAMIYYTAGVKAVNASREDCMQNNTNNYYESATNTYYKPVNSNYDTVAITFPKFNELVFLPKQKATYINDLENQIEMCVNKKYKDLDLKNTNILNFADSILENHCLSGYNGSTKLPTTRIETTSYIAYFTVANIPNQLLEKIYYQVNGDTYNDNVIIYYNENVNAANRTKEGLYGSNLYNSTTNYYQLNPTDLSNYAKFAISLSYNDKVLSLYSDLWNEGNPNYVTINQQDQEEEIVLPSNIYVVTNKNSMIYYNNCLRFGNPSKYQNIKVTGQFTLNTPECSIYNPESTGTSQARLTIYKYNTKDIYLSKYFNYVKVSSNAGSGTTKKVLMIGDSLTDSNVYLQAINTLMSSDSMNVTFIGTRDQAPYLNEGRSGWRAYTYCNCANGSDESTDSGFYQGSNPFYNPTSNTFDFSYYMTQNNFSNVDYVFINLGTNDISRDNHNTEEDIISYYNTMINSIKSYNANIKIALWLPPCRGLLNNVTGMEINDNFVFKMQKYLISHFDNNQVANVYIYNSGLMINPFKDYTTITRSVNGEQIEVVNDLVHPANSGYEKIGYATYFMIKYLASL